MSPEDRLKWRDILEAIEYRSQSLANMDGLVRSFMEIPSLAHRLTWCDIPVSEQSAVIEKLRGLAASYAAIDSPMAGHVAGTLTRTCQAVALMARPAHG